MKVSSSSSSGDNRLVRIGAYTNVQDRTVIDESFVPLGPDHDGSTIIGHYVTIGIVASPSWNRAVFFSDAIFLSAGHGCLLRACTIEDECHIGMGSILLDGSYLEKGSMLGARTVVPPHTRIPSGQVF